ncbi:MAG: MAPEG family protein [Parvularculaceae bacterium]|nr:MAPEG family protein [Parvularculaceae bacterium]
MEAVLPPLFIQVALTFFVLLVMATLRVGESLKDEKVAAAVKAGQKGHYSPRAENVSDNFKNQFELPVLFYAAVLLAIATGPISDFFVSLAWAFAISRVVHAAIHCTVNIVMIRFAVFGIGMVCLLLMWWELFQKTMAG